MDPNRKITKKFTKKFDSKVIDRQYFHRKTGLQYEWEAKKTSLWVFYDYHSRTESQDLCPTGFGLSIDKKVPIVISQECKSKIILYLPSPIGRACAFRFFIIFLLFVGEKD